MTQTCGVQACNNHGDEDGRTDGVDKKFVNSSIFISCIYWKMGEWNSQGTKEVDDKRLRIFLWVLCSQRSSKVSRLSSGQSRHVDLDGLSMSFYVVSNH